MTKAEDKKKSLTTKDSVIKNLEVLADKLPASIKPHVLKAAPYIGTASQVMIEKVIPACIDLFSVLKKFWDSLEPYRPDLLIPSFIGLIMCFFGGSFLTLIAAIEAYRMTGYKTTIKCFQSLYDDLKKVAEANEKDNQKDDDNDGTPDVLQISHQELLTRKTLLFLKTVDPNRLTEAISGINAGFLAVIATLKIQFAKTITLGNAIGSIVEEPASKYILPLIEQSLPPEYKKWAFPVLSYTIRSIAVTIAWTLQRIISAFHSAIRGGLMFSRNILNYLSAMNYVHIDHEKTYLDEVAGYGVALLGLWFQLSLGFSLPFPLNIFLLPFSILEYLLLWAVNSTK